MNFPVVAEAWNAFETALQMQAKRLVEDIAKHQNSDFKPLWAKVKPQIRVGLLDVELPDPLPTQCNHPSNTNDGGAIKTRCRAPCLLGYDACPKHYGTQMPPESDLPKVDRILDCTGQIYFVDPDGVARDRNGRAKGIVLEGVLSLFETT